MGKAFRDASVFALVGVLVGLLPGALAAGAFATWRIGGDLRQIDLMTILRFSPLETGHWGEPFATAVLIGGGVIALFGLGSFALGFRKPLRSYGSAHWATADELRRAKLLARLGEIRGPIFAKVGKPSSQTAYLSSAEIPHSLIAAPTGSGKGVGVVIPTLLTYPGSTIVLDLKGENFERTSRARQANGDRIFRFSPYADHGRTHRFNPLDDMARSLPRRRFSEARRLAASLIVAKSKSAEGFLEGSRDIFAAAAVVAIEKRTPTIGAVYDLLSGSGDARDIFEKLAGETSSTEAAKIFNRMAATDARVLSSYLSVLADGGLSLWADPAVRDATAASDFSIHDLRRDPASIYIVVSPNDLVPLAPLIRLVFQQVIAVMQRAEPMRDEAFPVLFVLDEFASLGRMEILSSAITTIRSYGGRVMIVVQSLASLRDAYGRDGAENFLANCRLQLFMAPGDEHTPEYISRAIGDFTRKARSTSWTIGRWDKAVQEREEGARLIRPDELRLLDDDQVVVLIQNRHPAKLHKVRYYADRGLRAIYEGQTGPLPEPPALYADEANPLYGARRAVEARSGPEASRLRSETASAPVTPGEPGAAARETAATMNGDAEASAETEEAASTIVSDDDVGRQASGTPPTIGGTEDGVAVAEATKAETAADADQASRIDPIIAKQRRLREKIDAVKRGWRTGADGER